MGSPARIRYGPGPPVRAPLAPSPTPRAVRSPTAPTPPRGLGLSQAQRSPGRDLLGRRGRNKRVPLRVRRSPANLGYDFARQGSVRGLTAAFTKVNGRLHCSPRRQRGYFTTLKMTLSHLVSDSPK